MSSGAAHDDPGAAAGSGYDETIQLITRSPQVIVVSSGAGGDAGSRSRRQDSSSSDCPGAPPSAPPAVTVQGTGSGKPVLMRQDCTTFLSSGGLGLGGSEESATSGCGEVVPVTNGASGGTGAAGGASASTRSVPDIELHCRLQAQVCFT